MAMFITADCINCEMCVHGCPNDAIRLGDSVHVIDAGKCTECKGAFDRPQCAEVCAVACVVAAA